MSYADYLRTRELNKAVIFDRRQRLGDASNYIQRTKLANSWIRRPTDHVINNQSDPFVPNPSKSKAPRSFVGSGAGGRVQDASLFTLSRGARAIGADIFSSTKTVQRELVPCADRATPAPSLVVANGLNFDGNRGGDYNPVSNSFGGLNSGYAEPCSLFRPLGNTQLVVRNPVLDRLGVQARSAWNGAAGTHYGSQNPLSPNCITTLTTANHSVKLIPHGNLNSRPLKTDFRTSITGPQVSANGAYGRPGKLGGALARTKYIEQHHGNSNIGHPYQYSYTEVKFNKPESYRIPKNA
jgi:hypothetical protein